MVWARMLAYITGTVDQELLLRNEYLAAENRILKVQIKGRLLLSYGEKATLSEIAYRLGRKALREVAMVARATKCQTKPWATFCGAMELLPHTCGRTASDDGSIPVKLGPFQEQFRTYLMGQAAFPKDASLWFVVREGKQINRLTYAPIGARQGNFHAYKFPMPGFAFSMLVSKNIPANHRERCFVHGPGNPVIVTTLIDKLLVDDAVKMRQKALDGIPA
jgi:hypothetical protein